jgi:hypothetical protein
MSGLLPILAQPLAPDCIGLAILFLVVLSLMYGLGSLSNRLAERRPAWHRLHERRHGPHELISHRHH